MSTDVVSWLRLVFGVLIVALFAYVYVAAQDFASLARVFPATVGAIGTLLAAGGVILDIVKVRRTGTCVPVRGSDTTATLGSPEPEVRRESLRAVLRYLAWLLGFVVVIYFAGVVVGVATFLAGFLHLEAKFRWWQTLIGVVATVAALLYIGDLMNLRWPPNVLDLL